MTTNPNWPTALTNPTAEIWKPLPGWETRYLISSHGRIWSLPRAVPSENRWGSYKRGCGGRFRKPNPRGQIALCRNGKVKYVKVANLVRQAFGDDARNAA